MCGRYYVDDETVREIEKIVRNLDQKLYVSGKKDVYPSSMTTVLIPEDKQVFATMSSDELKKWQPRSKNSFLWLPF